MALISVEEALARVLDQVRPLAPETVALDEALDRALGAAVVATRTLPPWDNSAMDGYAVRADDAGARRVIETVFAGQTPKHALSEGTATRIMTGAQVPLGADAVVMQERTTRDGDLVTLTEPVAVGANIRRRGEDVTSGVTLFEEGAVLGLAEAGALWAQGLERVSVRRRPRVAIASSGDELCDVGRLEPGKIVDSNSPVIAAAARRAGAIVTRLGRAPDALAPMTELFRRGLDGHDVLITLAGASVGERDFTREALTAAGVSIDFWKVAMKPGKPLALGRRGDTLVLGLPGNPVSAMVTFELFVRPALRALQGLPPTPSPLPARAAVALPKSAGLRLFVRATTEVRDGAVWATPLGSQSSGAMRSAMGATCLIALPPESGPWAVGSEISVIPLSWAG